MARLESAGSMTTADLARAEAVKPQSMGKTLAAMEAEKLINGQPDRTDGRQIQFALTTEGYKTLQATRLAKAEWLLAAVSKLTSAEQKTLIRAIEIIRHLAELGAAD